MTLKREKSFLCPCVRCGHNRLQRELLEMSLWGTTGISVEKCKGKLWQIPSTSTAISSRDPFQFHEWILKVRTCQNMALWTWTFLEKHLEKTHSNNVGSGYIYWSKENCRLFSSLTISYQFVILLLSYPLNAQNATITPNTVRTLALLW